MRDVPGYYPNMEHRMDKRSEIEWKPGLYHALCELGLLVLKTLNPKPTCAEKVSFRIENLAMEPRRARVAK